MCVCVCVCVKQANKKMRTKSTTDCLNLQPQMQTFYAFFQHLSVFALSWNDHVAEGEVSWILLKNKKQTYTIVVLLNHHPWASLL